MRPHLVLRMLIYTTLAVVSAGFLMAQDLPSYMAPISGRTVSSPAETAMKNVLALNTSMFELYDNAHKVFESNILSRHPVILGLFSGAGGRFILYRPGMAPLEAPSVPIVYQVLKSVDHSTMALAQVVGPYLDNPADQSWRAPMLSYRARMQAALDGLNELSMPADWRGNDHSILQNNIAFMDDCLAKSAVSFAALEAFARKQAPHHCRPRGWRAVLRQLLHDGLRTDGQRCARGNHRRKRQIRDPAFPASGGTVRVETVADAVHSWARTRFARRPSMS